MSVHKAKIKIGEIEFEAEGTAEFIERERNIFMSSVLASAVDAIIKTKSVQNASLPEYLPNLSVDANSDEETSTSALTIMEDLSRTNLSSFLSDKGNLEHQDFVLFAAYFDEKKNGNKTFTSENVKQYYAEARRSKYSNVSALLSSLAQKGYIMDAPDAEHKNPKPYTLTDTGLEYLEKYQPKAEQEKKTSKPRKARTKAVSVYASLNVDDLNLGNYPKLDKLSSFKEQMILIMYIVTKENKGSSFSVADIQCLLTDKIGLHATVDQINNIFKKNKTWFKSEPDSDNKKALKRSLLNDAKKFAEELITKSQ